MNLNQLLYFCSVARTGSYTRAADEWNVSQPVVHRAVKSLERSCAIKLLEHAGKRVRLTTAGRSVYDYAAQIASLKNKAEQALAQEKGLMSGTIAIGTCTAVGSYLLPHILAQWTADHPLVTVAVRLAQTRELQALLLADETDLLLTSGTKWAPGIQRELIFSDTLVVVSPPDNRLTALESVSIRDLSNERLLAPFRGSWVREEIEQVQYQFGVQFRVAMEISRQDTMKQLCRAGVGIAVLPKSVVAEELATGQLRMLNVDGFPRSHAYFLVYRIGKSFTPEMQSLISAIYLWADGRKA